MRVSRLRSAWLAKSRLGAKMDDGMEDFQAATVAIGDRNYPEAVRLLHVSERKAADAKPVGPVAEIKALRETCEAQIGHGD